jgi:hypothetical protein
MITGKRFRTGFDEVLPEDVWGFVCGRGALQAALALAAVYQDGAPGGE